MLFQPKSWVDRNIAIEHVHCLKRWFKDNVEGESYIGLDNLDAQIQYGFYKAVKDDWNAVCEHPPGGDTDGLQAVDDGYGKDIKFEMGQAQDHWLDVGDNIEKWEDGKLSASDRRILLTRLFADAVDAVNDKMHALWRYHERTGSIITVDGSHRKHLMSGGEKEYTIGPVPAYYGSMQSLAHSEEVLVSAEAEVTPEPDGGSDIDDMTLEEFHEFH